MRWQKRPEWKRALVDRASRGPATERGSRPVDAVVGDGDDTPVFVVSDASERDIPWRTVWGALGQTALGSGVAAVGGYLPPVATL